MCLPTGGTNSPLNHPEKPSVVYIESIKANEAGALRFLLPPQFPRQFFLFDFWLSRPLRGVVCSVRKISLRDKDMKARGYLLASHPDGVIVRYFDVDDETMRFLIASCACRDEIAFSTNEWQKSRQVVVAQVKFSVSIIYVPKGERECSTAGREFVGPWNAKDERKKERNRVKPDLT